jgi:hypothetical protein
MPSIVQLLHDEVINMASFSQVAVVIKNFLAQCILISHVINDLDDVLDVIGQASQKHETI